MANIGFERPEPQHAQQEDRVLMRPDGSLMHCEIWEPNENRVFMRHSDGVTYDRLEQISGDGVTVYINYRYTEITDPTWYNRVLYWLMDRL